MMISDILSRFTSEPWWDQRRNGMNRTGMMRGLGPQPPSPLPDYLYGNNATGPMPMGPSDMGMGEVDGPWMGGMPDQSSSAPVPGQRRRGVADLLRGFATGDVFGGAQGQSVPDDVRREAGINALLSAAAGVSSSPNMLGGLVQGIAAGRDAYSGTVSSHLKYLAEEQQRHLDEEMQRANLDAVRSNVEIERSTARFQQDEAKRKADEAIAKANADKIKKESRDAYLRSLKIDPSVADVSQPALDAVLKDRLSPDDPDTVTLADGRLAKIDPVTGSLTAIPGDNPVRPRGSSGGSGDGTSDDWQLITRGNQVIRANPNTGEWNPVATFEGTGADRMAMVKDMAGKMYSAWEDKNKFSDVTPEQRAEALSGFLNIAGKAIADAEANRAKAKAVEYFKQGRYDEGRSIGASGGVPQENLDWLENQWRTHNSGQQRTPSRRPNPTRPLTNPGNGADKGGAAGIDISGVRVPTQPQAGPRAGVSIANAPDLIVDTRGTRFAGVPIDELISDTADEIGTSGEAKAMEMLKQGGLKPAQIQAILARAKGLFNR